MANTAFATQTLPTEAAHGRPLTIRGIVKRFLRVGLLGVAFSLLLGSGLAVVLHLTWKDSLPALAPLFYATPLALIWGGLAASSGMFFWLRKPRLAMVTAVAAMACWSHWQNAGMAASHAVPSPDSVQVVFWNTARLKFGWQPVARQIQAKSAPLMGFVEAGGDDPKTIERWRQEFPDHQAIFFGNGMVLLAQGKILETSQGVLGRGSYFGRAVWEWQGQRVTVFLVDIHSNPFFSREESLGQLTSLASACDGPVVLMGDFNTPSDSVHFADLRRDFQNAFEAGGQGNLATWPVPFPVLAIDHIWTNRQVNVHFARQEWSLQSDHQAVIAELSFRE